VSATDADVPSQTAILFLGLQQRELGRKFPTLRSNPIEFPQRD